MEGLIDNFERGVARLLEIRKLCCLGFCEGGVSSSCESQQHVEEERRIFRNRLFFLAGIYHKKLNYLATRHGSQRNFSRCLHTLIHKKGFTLPVEIDAVTTRVKILRQRKVVQRPWPVLFLSSWIRTTLRSTMGFTSWAARRRGMLLSQCLLSFGPVMR